ncbi:MAG: hypothetical protein ACE37H_00300 [Phycisphaeraceae bacterium]
MIDLIASTQIERLFWARPLPTAAMVGAFLAVIAYSLFLYRRAAGLKPRLRVGLGGARLVVLALVVAMLFEPTAVVRETTTHQRTLPVLVDVSASMAIKDPRKVPGDLAEAAVALDLVSNTSRSQEQDVVLNLDANQRQQIADASRLDLATSLLRKPARPVFESIGDRLDVSYHAFAGGTRMIGDDSVLSETQANQLAAIEQQTSIAGALEAAAKAGGTPPAGIVLVSDGVERGGALRTQAILRDLGARGIPVFTVPVGMANPDDVSIQSVVMQEVAYSGDQVPVRVQVRSKGYEKRTARLSVRLNDRQVATRTVRFEGGLQFEEIEFRVDVYEKGAAQIDIDIEPFDDEVAAQNNRVRRSIRVVNEKVNVLYIEGNQRWEYRYLRAILKRDPRINATFIASNAGPEVARNSPEHIERFPDRREDAFQYDLVILGDVDAKFFTDEEFAVLEELVRDHGASLLMLCGPMYSPTSYQGTAVQTMLPVRFEPDARWERVAESAYPVLTPDGRSSLVMTLENEKELNDRVWSRMAPMDHLPPLLGAKPGATVLAVLSEGGERDGGYPLVAWQRYGTGKCMSIATDRLWRLRYKTGDKYHWRVWSQCIQFMTLSRLMGEHKRIRLETDRTTYALEDRCRVYAHVLDEDFEPVVQPGLDVYVRPAEPGAARQRITLRPDRAHPGMYEGTFTPPSAGRYRVEPSESDQRIANTTEFQVAEIDDEQRDTNVDLDHLERIAKLTGGARLTMQQLDQLPSLIDTEPITTTTTSERSLWDNGWVALLLIGLAGIEWVQRRRHDLP